MSWPGRPADELQELDGEIQGPSRDVADGLISPKAAAEYYGVAVAADGRINWRRTSELRAER